MNEISTEAEAEALIVGGPPSWILKHSSTCGISAAAYEEVEGFLAGRPMPIGVVVVQQARPLSNWLAGRLKRVHQSPQLFLMVSGEVRWSASHYGITRQAMEKALAG